jgi:hypothetical protein
MMSYTDNRNIVYDREVELELNYVLIISTNVLGTLRYNGDTGSSLPVLKRASNCLRKNLYISRLLENM